MTLLKAHPHKWHSSSFLKSPLEASRSLTVHTKPSHGRAYKRADPNAQVEIKANTVGPSNHTLIKLIKLSMRYRAFQFVPDKPSAEFRLQKACTRCLSWHVSYLNVFPVVRSRWSFLSTRPGSGSTRWSEAVDEHTSSWLGATSPMHQALPEPPPRQCLPPGAHSSTEWLGLEKTLKTI